MPIETQKLAIDMKKRGVSDVVVEKITKINRAAIPAIVEQGMPFVRGGEVRRCPNCRQKINTNYCLACLVKFDELHK